MNKPYNVDVKQMATSVQRHTLLVKNVAVSVFF